jgi:hypothetical protein
VVTTSHSFNPTLVHAIGAAVSTEARVFNNHGGHAGACMRPQALNQIHKHPLIRSTATSRQG